MKIKKIFATAAMALATLGSSAVWANNQDPVRVFYYSLNDMYINQLSTSLQDLAIGSGIKIAQFDAQDDLMRQASQIQTALSVNKKKTPILVNPVDNQNGLNALRAAKQQNVPIIFFNRKPTQEALSSYKDAWYVGANINQAGYYQASLVIEALKQHPEIDRNKDGYINYVILKGEPSHVDTAARSNVFVRTMLDAGIKLKPVAVASGKWSPSIAQNEMTRIISEKGIASIELIVSNNDAMALGAVKSLQAVGYNNPDVPNSQFIPVFGIDAIPAALEAIERGVMTGTVLNDYKATADVMIRMAKAYIDGQPITEDLIGYPIKNCTIEIPYSPIYNFNLGTAAAETKK